MLTTEASLKAGVPGAEPLFGPDFFTLVPQLLAADAETVITARRTLLDTMTALPLAPADLPTRLGASVQAPLTAFVTKAVKKSSSSCGNY